MGYRLHHRETHIEGSRELTDFDLLDEKGRAVGYVVSFSTVEWSVDEDDYAKNSHEDVQAEVDELSRTSAFYGATSATRDGQGFGAWNPGVFAPTLEQVKAKVARRMAGARKRYEKKYGSK